jgi:pimeloyl-ACP methyl ester carboxylesterase
MVATRVALGSLPALVCGSGPPLVWLGGLSTEAGVDRSRSRAANIAAVAPYAGDRRVFFTNRRPGLPRGLTMAGLALEHAEALRAGFGGQPVDVVGVSTGGSIAQQLAAEHPQLVRRLVLQSTACRLGPLGRAAQRRAAARIRRGAYRRAMAVMAADLVPRHRGRVLAGAVAWTIGPHLFAARSDLQDMATTIEAEDGFDLATCRASIRAPTLLVAGTADRFYTPELFDETAALIPGCQTHYLPGRGHVAAPADPSVASIVLSLLSHVGAAGS